ncbi:MAG: hydroxymethylglutaryl-CoA reductase, degradative [Pseudobdellovibrionaceae bacterium]
MEKKSTNLTEAFKGFSQLTLEQRLETLASQGALSAEDLLFLKRGGLKDTKLGEKFIENVIGYFQMPLGVATNFRIDGVERFIPMAVEETSIIAAASKTAKWILESGRITTEVVGQNIIGQIQFAKIMNVEMFQQQIAHHKAQWIEMANRDVANGLVNRGGGVEDITVRLLDRKDGFFMGVVHVLMNPCDAMGANIINQVCEYLKEPLENITGEKVSMCILSNLVDTKVTKACIELNNIDPELAEKIEEASFFAQIDPYRASTNNKGVLNGIDPIVLATGNDWRAVEAGIHAYASRDGQYRSVTQWKRDGKTLVGLLEAPLIVGIVGGVTTLHPMAALSLKLLNVHSANDLSRVMAAVGLAQNLGALKALTTVGIIEGHMKLHVKNLAIGAGAQEKEMPLLQKKLEEILALKKRISLSQAIESLKEIRRGQTDGV